MITAAVGGGGASTIGAASVDDGAMRWASSPRQCAHGVMDGCALFAPGTPPDYMDQINRAIAEAAGPTERFNLDGSKWSFGANPTGTLTYSFVPDSPGVLIPAAFDGDLSGNSILHQTLDARFSGHGGRSAWKQIFRDMFDRWSEITGIDYVEVPDNGAAWSLNWNPSSQFGQIRIAMRNMDGAFGVLAFNYYPNATQGLAGNMILDASENWGNSANDFRFLRNTIAHEHGHALGLRHICPPNSQKLMEPLLSSLYDGPQLDDIRGVQYLYGDQFEPNNTTTAAGANANLGVIGLGEERVVEELSIYDVSDIDYFRFTVPPEARVTIIVEPVGVSYNQHNPNENGSCPPETNLFNALTIGNLQFSLRNSVDVVLAPVTETGFGEPEILEDFEVPFAGTYHVRVSAAAMNGSVQMYRLRIQVFGPPGSLCEGDLNGDGVVNAQDLGIMLSYWGTSNPVGDLNGDGVVNAQDLAELLSRWGQCA